MGHIGLTPQSHSALGGYRIQGRTAQEARTLLDDALALQEAGCFAVVLEMVPGPVSAEITARLDVPTIGIGAGVGTSGQVAVFHDVLGLHDGKLPRFAHQFGRFEAPMTAALSDFNEAVSTGIYPQQKHTFEMSPDELLSFKADLGLRHHHAHHHHAHHHHANGHASGDASGTSLTPAAGLSDGRRHAAAGQLVAPLGGSPRVIRTVEEWRALRTGGALPAHTQLGLVPTMGALHEGHLSLLQRARSENEVVAASLFVNPAQFAPHEDLDSYPRTWEADLEKLSTVGADYVFAPTAAEMYPNGREANLLPFVEPLHADSLGEGARRPGFFRGVATVVAKLLNVVQPRRVYFGQKDGLQCVVVKRMVDGLNFDTQVVVGETLREPDGLAMSSRNVYLREEERRAAPAVYKALQALAARFDSGERRAHVLHEAALEVVARQPLMAAEYVSIASSVDGSELRGLIDETLETSPPFASVAVKLPSATLIDNIVLR